MNTDDDDDGRKVMTIHMSRQIINVKILNTTLFMEWKITWNNLIINKLISFLVTKHKYFCY
jgi:hypothetical protein